MSFLELHAAYEARFPDELEMARAYAQHREMMFLRAHGDLEGFEAERMFPCPGALRAVEDHGSGISTVRCDVCRFETTARLPST